MVRIAEQNSIEWHEEAYKNWKQSLDIHEERLQLQWSKLLEDKKRLSFFRHQIDEAIKEKKTKFDRERFRISKTLNKGSIDGER